MWAVGRASDTEVLKLPVTKIALGVGRNKTTVYKALEESFKIEKRGRPDLLTKQEVNLLVRTIKAMVKKAQGCYEVTLAMVRKRAKVRAMHSRGPAEAQVQVQSVEVQAAFDHR